LSDNTGTSGTGDQSDSDGTTFTSNFTGYGMRFTDFITPISFSDGRDVQFGVNDGTFDSSLNFFVAFSSESNMLFLVTNQNNSFESGSLTGSGHLLHGFQLHNFFFEFVFQEIVDDLRFFNWDTEFENFVQRLDFTIFD
jgi:hypothetical protein